jgi:hypothetical protein
MCDTSALRNWLVAALAAIVVAIALIAAAAILNASFWEAKESPALMVLAAASSAAAAVLCGLALSALDDVCACLAPQCAGECFSVRGHIAAAIVVLGIQATAALAAVWPAAIPLAGLGPMDVIAGALVVQAALFVSSAFFLTQLDRCALAAAEAVSPGTESVTQPLVVSPITSTRWWKRWRWRWRWRWWR